MVDDVIKKITDRKQYSGISERDVLKAFGKFDRDEYADEEKIKKTRDFLRRTFSGFGGKKILNGKFDNATSEDFLKKHLSTRERLQHYGEIYARILRKLPEKISIIDLGSGINGLSYGFFAEAGKKVEYAGVESLKQPVDLTNEFFIRENVKGKAYHLSLFDVSGVRKIIESTGKPRVVFAFKVADALESFERDYTKKLLEEVMPLADRFVLSFATESWVRRKKFFVTRKWITEFIRERWNFIDDFEAGGERYLVFE